MGQAQARQHRRHSNRRADAFDHRHTELFLQPIGFDVHRTLADAHRINHFGALLDESFGFADEIIDDFIVVRRQIRQVETADAEADDAIFHPVAANNRAGKRHQARVIDHDAESVADQRCDVETGFGGTDDRNIDRRFAAIDAQVERAERHHGVVAFLLGAFEASMNAGATS